MTLNVLDKSKGWLLRYLYSNALTCWETVQRGSERTVTFADIFFVILIGDCDGKAWEMVLWRRKNVRHWGNNCVPETKVHGDGLGRWLRFVHDRWMLSSSFETIQYHVLFIYASLKDKTLSGIWNKRQSKCLLTRSQILNAGVSFDENRNICGMWNSSIVMSRARNFRCLLINAHKCLNVQFFNDPAPFCVSVEKCPFLGFVHKNSILLRMKARITSTFCTLVTEEGRGSTRGKYSPTIFV